MPIAVILGVLNILLIFHAAKTGRFWPWGWVILLLPGIGALGYVLLELVPEWMGTPTARHAQRRLVNSLDPEKRYRELDDELALTDTIANRAALAEECLALEKFAEARRLYEQILAQPLGDDPLYALGKARAEFGLGQPGEAVATLDWLRVRWPDYQSAEGHLLYARALEASDRSLDALEEYRAVADYYPGPEARVRLGLLLTKLGHRAEAKTLFTDLVVRTRRAPPYARKLQAEWIAIAERELRD